MDRATQGERVELSPEMIADGWQPMDSAPHDFSVFAVCFNEWNRPGTPIRYQLAQRRMQLLGGDFEFHAPFQPEQGVYANAWMPLERFASYKPEISQ